MRAFVAFLSSRLPSFTGKLCFDGWEIVGGFAYVVWHATDASKQYEYAFGIFTTECTLLLLCVYIDTHPCAVQMQC